MQHPLINLVKDKEFLLSLSEKNGTPLFVYDKTIMQDNLLSVDKALKSNFDDYHICYTIKANNNPMVIKALKCALPTLGADCSSPGDIHAAKLGGIDSSDCIFTGNYESEDDLKIAYKNGTHINLDDISSFSRLIKIGIPKEISFRLNPGFGKGAFSQVVTGGKNSKFGVPKENIVEAYMFAKENGVKKFGIQCMTGSGVMDTNYFSLLMKEILNTVKRISDKVKIEFKHISIGGGYGIPYRENESPLDYNQIFNKVSNVFHNYFQDGNKPSLWIEPGRSIVGNSALLLSKVTGIKNSYKRYIGLEAGMETLMRPALYGAYHRIYKVGDPYGSLTQNVDFTGRICENTDRIAVNRSFTDIEENDLVAIMDVGAYGYVMSHQFCTRPRSAELMIDGKDHYLIRKKESIDDIFSNCILS